MIGIVSYCFLGHGVFYAFNKFECVSNPTAACNKKVPRECFYGRDNFLGSIILNMLGDKITDNSTITRYKIYKQSWEKIDWKFIKLFVCMVV